MTGPRVPTNPTQPNQPGVPPSGADGGVPPSGQPDLPPELPPDPPPADDGLGLFPEDTGGADQPTDPAKQQLEAQQKQQQALLKQGMEVARAQLDANIAEVGKGVEERGKQNEIKAEQRAKANEDQFKEGVEAHQEDRAQSDEANQLAEKKGKEFAALEQGERNQVKHNQKNRVTQRQKALVTSLKKDKTTPEALLKRSFIKNQKAQQAFEKLPAGLRDAIQSLGKKAEVLQFLKFKLQMVRLRAWQRAAQAQGETQLASQIQKAMDQLQKEAPPVPAELSQGDLEALESTTLEEDTGETQEGEEGSGEGEKLGLSREQRLATLEQPDQGTQGEGGESGPSQGESQPVAVVASNAGAIKFLQDKQKTAFVKTDGTREGQRNAEQRGAAGILNRMIDGLHVLFAEGEESKALARYAEGEHPLAPVSFSPQQQQGAEQQMLRYDNTETGGSGVRISTVNGRSLLPDQVFRAAEEAPEAEFINIAGLEVSRREIDRLAEFVGIRRKIDAYSTTMTPERMAFAVQHDSIPSGVFA